MSPEEEIRWKALQNKDTQAFEAYYKENYKFYLLSAHKYLGDIDLSRDIVNDVFAQLWQDAAKLTIQTSLRSYIYRTIVNRCLNHLDKNRRDRKNLQDLGRHQDESQEIREMEYQELKLRLYKAIDDLPDQARKVFKMSRFENLKQQQIADELGISIKTVKNHITYALQQLNKVLKDWHRLPIMIAIVKIFFRSH